MDQKLEQAILRALNESLGSKVHVQEAKGDWNTVRQNIALIRAFAPNQYPLMNLRAYAPATSGEKKDYKALVRDHVNTRYFEKYKSDHFQAVENGGPKRKILTRAGLGELLDQGPFPAALRKKWDLEYQTDLAAIQQNIANQLDSIYTQLADHSIKCTRYVAGKCISGTKLDLAFKKSSPGKETALLYGLDNPREVAKDLQSAIKLSGNPNDLNALQCSPSGAGSLQRVKDYIYHPESLALSDYVAQRNNLSANHSEMPLTEEDFELLKNNPSVGAAMMRADEIEVKPPLVAARASKLEHQIVWQIVVSSGIRKFDKDTDLCSEMKPVIQKIAENYDYEDEKGFFQIHIARQFSSLYGYDKVQAAFENVIQNWPEQCVDFLEATRPNYETSETGVEIAGINPSYAVPGSEKHSDPRDTGQVPRIDNNEGIGVGGEYGSQHPTVYEVYNDYTRDKLPKEMGFKEDFTWLVLFGTEESAVNSNRDGVCPICTGHGFINLDTVGIPTGGGISPGYWGVVLGQQDTVQAGGQRCSNCEGSGRTYPYKWQHSQPVETETEVDDEGNEIVYEVETYTPFEFLFREVWDLLVSLGYEPKAYDGFVTNKNELYLDQDQVPVPAPSRPEVETQYSQNREGELNTMGYTTIIRLDNSMGNDRVSVSDHFVDQFYPALQKRLASARMPVNLTDVGGDRTQDVMVYSLRREPRFTFKRKSRVYTDIGGSESVRDAAWVSDIEEFEREYLKIQSEGIDALVPSQDLLQELLKLESVARELEPYELYDITVPIYAFLEQENDEFKNRLRLIDNYSELVEFGRDSSYGDLLRYCLQQIEKHDIIKHPDKFKGVLTNLLSKATLFDIEIPGKGATDLDKVTDIDEELKLHLRYVNQRNRIQRRTLFKPGKREVSDLVIKGVEEMTPIANRINTVFSTVKEKHLQTDIPLDSQNNPIFYLLVPLGWDNTAEAIAGIDDMQVAEMLIVGNDGFEPHPYFNDSKSRRALAYYYWKAQIEGKSIFDVMKEEMSTGGEEAEYLSARDMFPNYGIVNNLIGIFRNNNDSYPEHAFAEMFAKGVELTKELYEETGEERLNEIYRKISKKAKPEDDIKKLEIFLKAARKRMQPASVKARISRANKKAREHDPKVISANKEIRENIEWKTKFSNHLADYLGMDLEEVDEEDQRTHQEIEIYKELKDVVFGAAKLVPEYNQYAQLVRKFPHTLMRKIGPIFNDYLLKKYNVTVNLQDLLYPGLDCTDRDIEGVLEAFDTMSLKLGLHRDDHGKIQIGSSNRSEMRSFFRSLLKDKST